MKCSRCLSLCKAVALCLLMAFAWTANADNPNVVVSKRVKKAEFFRPERLKRAATAADAEAFSVPFNLTPTQEQFARFGKLDANDDGKTWSLVGTSPETSLYYEYSYSLPADDWLFIPVDITDATAVYKLSVDLKVGMSTYPENFEVGIGSSATPSAMRIFMDENNLTNTVYKTFRNYFYVESTGRQYIGLHVNSDENKFGLYARNISVSMITLPTPEAPVIVSSSVDGTAYTASVQMPSRTVQNGSISGDLGLSVLVDGIETENDISCGSGELAPVSLTLAPGVHEITYKAYITTGNERSYSDPVSETVKATGDVNYSIPFTFGPTEDEFVDYCKVDDVNDDKSTWDYDTDTRSMVYSYSSFHDADDWVFLPRIYFGETGGAFELSLQAKAKSSDWPEAFEVCVGRSADPAAMLPAFMQADVDKELFSRFKGTMLLPEGGNWYVGIHAISEANMLKLFVKDISITAVSGRTPSVVTIKSLDFVGQAGTLIVTLPSQTIEGELLEENVGVIVKVDGVQYARTALQEPGSDVTIPMTNLALGMHTVTVAAYIVQSGDDLPGPEIAQTVRITHSPDFAYQLPFSMRPTKDEFEILTIKDANEDGNKLTYHEADGAISYKFSTTMAADEWVFFPKVAIDDASKIYRISVDARASLEQFPEAFEVCIGTVEDPASMNVIIDVPEVAHKTYKTYSDIFNVSQAGKYVVGIHVKSAQNMSTFYVKNICVEATENSANAPGTVEDVVAVPDQTGALKATISFRMPTKTIAGTDLAADAMVSVKVTSPTGKQATVSGVCGSLQSVIIDAADGNNTFTLTTSSAEAGEGIPSEVSVYCGIDTPSAPVVAYHVSEDNMSLVLSWEVSATGVNGGVVDPTQLSYTIYLPTLTDYGYVWDKIASLGSNEKTYSYALDAGTRQQVVSLGVSATNEKGESFINAGYGTAGVPYSLPMNDNFSGGSYEYSPLVVETPTTDYVDTWYYDYPGNVIGELMFDTDKALICTSPDGEGYFAAMSFPKFSTKVSKEVEIAFEIYDYGQMPKLEVYANSYDQKDVLVGEFAKTEASDWMLCEFKLPESLLGKEWVNLYVKATFSSYNEYGVIRSYRISNVFDNDFGVKLKADGDMVVGRECVILGQLTNYSNQSLPVPQFELVFTPENGTAETLTPAVAPEKTLMSKNETITYTYKYAPVAEDLGDAVVAFRLVGYVDEDNTNNEALVEVSVTTGHKPVVTDLVASESSTAGSVDLSWSAPELDPVGEDDVESYAAFSFNEQIGGWTNYDGDGKATYIFTGWDFDGQGDPKAFQVMNYSGLGVEADMEAHSGDQYFMAITPDDGSTADDWLISPQVVGGSAVSFWFNILTDMYGAETIEVKYSTTTAELAEFKPLQSFTKDRYGWEKCDLVLPDDARYFAFHYGCTDIFGVCIDDITYSPLTDAAITGYNIYRDGELIAENHQTTSFTDKVQKAEHYYNVATVVSESGLTTEFPLSNTARIALSSVDAVFGDGGISVAPRLIMLEYSSSYDVSVYTVDGIAVAKECGLTGYKEIPVETGFYLVTVAGQTYKVFVP